MGKQFRQICGECATRHRVEIGIEEIWTKPPVRFDQQCINAVSQAVSDLGYSNQQIVSGAGHDACQVVPMSMTFVPCAGGLSHNEHESAEPEDIEAGTNVLLHAVLILST